MNGSRRSDEVVFVRGKHLENLEDARAYARKEIDQFIDIPVPDAVFKRAYLFDTKDREEYEEYCERFKDIILNDPERLKTFFGTEFWTKVTLGGMVTPASSLLREAFLVRANDYLKKGMCEQMKDVGSDPVMCIDSSLESVPHYREIPLVRTNDFDCALQTFAMNAAALMDGDKESCSIWDAGYLRKAVESHHPHNAHDLPWLLGSLATNLASQVLQHDIRVRTFVGADFGEIEDRYILPIRKRSKAAKFILNTMVVSSGLKGANHFVTVTSASEDQIVVSDAKNGPLEIPTGEFWERWVPTNLQASLVIAIPK